MIKSHKTSTNNTKLNEKINVVQNVLHNNTELILQTDEKLIQLEQNVGNIEPLDKLHYEAMKELKNKIWRRQCKTKIIITSSITLLLLIIILAGACSKGYCK